MPEYGQSNFRFLNYFGLDDIDNLALAPKLRFNCATFSRKAVRRKPPPPQRAASQLRYIPFFKVEYESQFQK